MKLGEVLRKYRRMSDISLRELSIIIGVSPATLHRIEEGKMMDGRTLAAIIEWLTQPAEAVGA